MQSDLQDAPPMMKNESAKSKTESSALVKKDNSTSPQPLRWIIKNSIDSSNVYAKDDNVGSIETAQKKVVLKPREITQKHSDSGDSPQMVKAESSTPPQSFKRSRKSAQVDVEDGGDESIGSTSNQLVLYNCGAGSTTQDIFPVDHSENYTKSFQSMIATNPTSRVLPSVGTFTVQCASCFKWRLIPTKEKYEEIREHVLERPFTCERARSWRPDITCDDPADISQDGSRLWAIDKPNIALPPPGWERQLRIRGEGGTKFADVYYVAPSGKRLRSMVEVQKYLLEHPEYIDQGVKLSQFSFQIPRPLQENYVRKRPARVPNPLDGGSGLQRPLEPDEVNPLSWMVPTDDYHQVHQFHESQVYHHRPSPQSPTPPPTSLSPPSKKKSTKPRIHIKHCGGNNSSTVVQSEEQF